MKKILGMPLSQPKLSDEEYVEQVRSRLHRRRWHALLFGTAGIVHLGCFSALTHFVFDVLPHDPEITRGMHPGFAGGLIIGTMAGMLALLAGSCVFLCVEVVRGNRTERLLIRFHDLSKTEAPSV